MMREITEIDEATARNIVKNHRFDIYGDVATYWMKRCDEAELEVARLGSRLDALHRSKYEYAKAENDRLREAARDMCREWRLHGQLTDSCRPMERLLGVHAPFCPVHSGKGRECDLALAPPADGGGGE